MPAWDIEVNGQATTAKDIQRKKKQKITYPCGESFVPDLMKTVRTGLGVGEIEKLSLRLTSRMATINLRFTTV
jgi:NOL1/NOP2/fmu family ribosome biogenesis protein